MQEITALFASGDSGSIGPVAHATNPSEAFGASTAFHSGYKEGVLVAYAELCKEIILKDNKFSNRKIYGFSSALKRKKAQENAAQGNGKDGAP